MNTLSILADEVKFVDESVVTVDSNDTFESPESIAGLAAMKQRPTFQCLQSAYPFHVIIETLSQETPSFHLEFYAPSIRPTT